MPAHVPVRTRTLAECKHHSIFSALMLRLKHEANVHWVHHSRRPQEKLHASTTPRTFSHPQSTRRVTALQPSVDRVRDALTTVCRAEALFCSCRTHLSELRDMRHRGNTLNRRLEDVVHSVLHLVEHGHLADVVASSCTTGGEIEMRPLIL